MFRSSSWCFTVYLMSPLSLVLQPDLSVETVVIHRPGRIRAMPTEQAVLGKSQTPPPTCRSPSFTAGVKLRKCSFMCGCCPPDTTVGNETKHPFDNSDNSITLRNTHRLLVPPPCWREAVKANTSWRFPQSAVSADTSVQHRATCRLAAACSLCHVFAFHRRVTVQHFVTLNSSRNGEIVHLIHVMSTCNVRSLLALCLVSTD